MKRDRTVRKYLYKMFNGKGFKRGCEVGVLHGENAISMLECMPELKLHLIDPWDDSTFEKMLERIGPYKHRTTIINAKSEQAVLDIPDGYFDFVYIDADHSYNAAMLDIILWGHKVKKGGILSGHDYVKTRKHGVKNAVDDYVRQHGINLNVFERNWYWDVI